MIDREKVIKGLEQFKYDFKPFCGNNADWKKVDDAIALLKEQQGTGCWEWITEDKYRCSECQNTTYVDECMEEPQYLFCPYCGHKMTFAGKN